MGLILCFISDYHLSMNLELKWNEQSGLQCQSWIDRGISHGFSFDLDHRPTEIFSVRQVHGTDCHEVFKDSRLEEVQKIQADALTTLAQKKTLGIQTADCLPILVADFDSGRLAAIHAGWRGLSARILSQYLGFYSSNSNKIEVLVGPSISLSMFEVGPEVVDQMKSSFPEISLTEWGAFMIGGRDDRSFIDLAGLAKRELESQGIPSDNVAVSQICTKSDLSWNSYRRNGTAAGRNWAWIGRSG